jgi:hypothetical protein
MSPIQPPNKPLPVFPIAGMSPCRHARVQVVSRVEDSEYVECVECGEVFDASEFKDMEIEEGTDEET